MKRKTINNKCIDYTYNLIGEKFLSRKKNEFECLLSMSDLGKYVGKWIAIVDDKIVFTGEAGKLVFQKARKKYPTKIPMILKVPSNANMLL